MWSKLHSSFVKALLEKHLVWHDGAWYIHPAYNTAIVETYRLSSSKPNIQQIPRKNKNNNLNIKSQFISEFPNGWLINADYAQMEMRVAAMLSMDPALIAAIQTDDIHLTTAEMMFRVPAGTFTKESEERQRAKTIGFATMYGAGARTIGRQLGIPKEQAAALIELYFQAYPDLKKYIGRVHEDVTRTLDVVTPFGYRRMFTAPTGGNWNKWDGFKVKRQAFNTIIQSTAACIMYVAIVDIHTRLKEEGLRSRLLNTVHDSLLAGVYPGEMTAVRNIIKECMTYPGTERYGVKITVPLGVDLEVGKNWGEMEKVA
jgi:DNA polymerase-1